MGVSAAGAFPTDPAPLADEVVRSRLVERLALRFTHAVTVVEAPGGYGKSVALAQARRANSQAPAGIDLAVACRPTHRDALRLVADLLAPLGSDVPRSATESIDIVAGALVDRLASMAPTHVCVMLDDVHHLEDDDESVGVLAVLLRALPTNAHVALSGRRIPRVPLARFVAADQVVLIDQSALAFDATETSALAAHHGADPAAVEASGWPALTRLALAVGRSATLDFLLEEVVDHLDPGMRRALAATVVGRRVDDEALKRIVESGCTTEDILAAVPLVSRTADGTLAAHDIWGEAADRLADPDELERLARELAAWHMTNGRYDDAFEIAAGAGAWDAARQAVMAALDGGDALLSGSQRRRWLRRFPESQTEEPELCLLRGVVTGLEGDLADARLEVEKALDLFTRRGDHTGRAAAAVNLGIIAWLTDDIGTVLQMVQLGHELEGLGVESVAWLTKLGEAGVADLQGEPERARALVAEIDTDAIAPEVAIIVLRWRCMLGFLVGDSEAGVAAAEQMLTVSDDEGIRLMVAIARWQHGDPTDFRSERRADLGSFTYANARDDFIMRALGAFTAASLGLVADVDDLADRAWGGSRDASFASIARAVSLVAAGDEERARGVLHDLLDRYGIEDPMCQGELRRFAGFTFGLSARVGDGIAVERLGGKHRERAELALLFAAARAEETVDWDRLPPPSAVLTGLPLPWSIELAARAAAVDESSGLELAEYLIDFCGPVAQDILRSTAARGGTEGDGAAAILSAIPAPPAERSVITACGDLTVDGPDPHGHLRRVRVRELLGLLLLRDRVRTDTIVEALWPGLDPSGGRKNLRTTLSYLRDLLEPERHRGEPSFHVRRRDDELWLERSSYLQVDLWDLRDALTRGRALGASGRLGDAVGEYRRVVDLWVGEVLPDLRDNAAAAAEITYLDLEIESAAAQVAEWCLAHGDDREACRMAERLLAHDPYAERAHGAVIAAHMAAGALTEAVAAAQRCRDALAELGVEPTASTAMILRRLDGLARTQT